MTDHICKLLKLFSRVWDHSLRLTLLVFHAKFLFPKDNRLFLKKELESLFPFRSTLYCPLDDQKPLEKQAFWLKSINNTYYYISHDKVITLQITSALLITNYDSFFITNYDKVLTNCDRYYKSRQNNYKLWHHYKLRQLLIAGLHARACCLCINI